MNANIGDLITSIGAAWDAGDLTLAQAVAKLRDADPTLTALGARVQIQSWQSAAARYRPRPDAPALDARRVSAAGLRREPIVFRFNGQGAA